MKKIVDWFVNNLPLILLFSSFTIVIVYVYSLPDREYTRQSEPLKEFKDGIQNHLVWSLKGECYFVRPNDDVTVYLIRVNDCDKK